MRTIVQHGFLVQNGDKEMTTLTIDEILAIVNTNNTIASEIGRFITLMTASFSSLTHEKIIGGSLNYLYGEVTPESVRDAVFKYYLELVN